MDLNKSREIPAGLAAALGRDTRAMEYFAALPAEQKERIISHANMLESPAKSEAYGEILISNMYH